MNSTQSSARLAGALYLLTSITGFFDLMYIPRVFVVSGDAASTARRIVDGERLYRIGILSGLLSEIFFVLLVLSLYQLLKDVDRKRARLMLVSAILIVPVGFAHMFTAVAPLLLLGGASFLSVFTRPQLEALALGCLILRGRVIVVESAFWGIWLLPFGSLVIRSGLFPRVLGILLIAAGVAYLTGSFTLIVWPHANIVTSVTLPLEGIGELSMVLWLLARGVRTQPLASHASV